MSKQSLFSRCLFVGLFSAGSILSAVSESPDNLFVRSVSVEVVGEGVGADAIISALKTRERERFSQSDFDKDLKLVAKEFDQVEPSVEVVDGEVVVVFKVVKKPIISAIKWQGNTAYTNEKLQKELRLSKGVIYDREGFARAIQRLRQFYVKHGFFEVEINHSTEPGKDEGAVDVVIDIKQGRAGYIESIEFENFTDEEVDNISAMMFTKNYSVWLSWLNNQGTFFKEAFAQDEMRVLNYLQDRGYLDARVESSIRPSNKLRIG